jgi:4-carboxymuconolactone decarboxylase
MVPFDDMWHMMYIHSTVNLIQVPAAEANKINKQIKGKKMAKSERFEKGMVVRRKVLGDAYVDQAMQKADDFSMPLQDFVTENAWGTVWVRDGLTLKQRSLITVSAIIAMNRPHELKLHVRGAINNGVSKEELREVFLHCGAYCGAPAVVDAFRIAREVFAEDAKATG